MSFGIKTARGVGVHTLAKGFQPLLDKVHGLARLASITDYTAVAIQEHTGLRVHRDAANSKPSYLTTVGEYGGGQLWLADPSGDQAAPTFGAQEPPLFGELFDDRGRWL
eukprot:2970320-Amphidinium_carterae.1